VFISFSLHRIGTEDDIVFHEFRLTYALSSAYAASNRTSALYRVLFWMIYRRDAFVAASSISALPPPFFYVLPTERIESDALDHRQRLSSLRSLRHVHLSSSFFFFLLFSHSISSLYISEWQALVTSSLQPPQPVDCAFRHLTGFKKWEEEGKSEKKRMRAREQEGTTNSAKEKRRKAVWSINEPLSFYLFCRFYRAGGPLSADRERTVSGEWIFLPNILVYICIRIVRAESEQIQYPGNRLNDSRTIPQLVRQGRRYIVIYRP